MPHSHVSSLEQAREALAEAEGLIAALEAERLTALVGDDDRRLARIESRLEGARRQHRTACDRVAVRQAEVEKESQAKAAAERDVRIAEIAAKFRERDEAGRALAEHVKAADDAFVRVLGLNQQIGGMWPWQLGDLGACMCSVGAATAAVSNELYRHARPAPGGGQPHDLPPSFPAAFPADYMLAMDPARSAKPLIDRLAEGTKAGIAIMKKGYHAADEPMPVAREPVPPLESKPAPPSANGHATVPLPPLNSPEGIEYAALLARNSILAEAEQTPEVEREYQQNLRRMERLNA
jgi:hypothetical protein